MSSGEITRLSSRWGGVIRCCAGTWAQRVDAVIYRRLDELFRDGHRRGLLPPPELLGEITRGALERLLASQLPRDTVLYGAIRSVLPSIDDDQLRGVMATARSDEQEVGL